MASQASQARVAVVECGKGDTQGADELARFISLLRGPIAVLKEGDTVAIHVESRELRVELSDDEIEARLGAWTPPAPRYESGVLAKYAALVSSASEGAVTWP